MKIVFKLFISIILFYWIFGTGSVLVEDNRKKMKIGSLIVEIFNIVSLVMVWFL